ncbi:MAG: coproporphyrinogen III oxidase [Bacteroidetes bacterium]|nr:MAG: coproporphyrinogen III oxidase [Bacteroidota bacterium]
MAGIYIHIPFCKTKCHYCNFFSMASDKLKPQFISILKKEINLQKDYLANKQINTIYLGGGTPSLFNARELSGILEEIYANFNVSADVEITLEANPDDVSESWVKQISQTGINRISLGVQSFFDEDLAYLKRVHNAADAENAIHRLQDTGISNISIDLIYGIPTLKDEKWTGNLEKFLSFDIPHLSAYALTVEEKTALHVLIKKKKIISPDDDMIAEQFNVLLSMTTEKGYVHYEISNFAREGFYSKHNSLYWTGGHYLGLGPSAHSYNGSSRRWNKPSMKAWLSLLEYYGESFEEEVLSTDQRYNEYVMTSLRTVWGCDIDLVRQEFGEQYASNLLKGASKYIGEESLVLKGNRLFLTTKGKLFADGIASGLFA